MRVCVIPARGGSRRIPRKNIREFHGKPIIAYSIETAKRSGLFDRVYVSTEDREIAEVARLFGALPILRDLSMALDHVGTQEVMADAVRDILDDWVDEYLACCIYATAPMLTVGDLHRGYDAMRATDSYSYIHGWYYWGRAEWFGDEPLTDGVELAKPADRWIDINDEADWLKAEQMYSALHLSAA